MKSARVLFISWLVCVCTARIPDVYYQWAEPDANNVAATEWRPMSHEVSSWKLHALRDVLGTHSPAIHAYIIPTADAHNSQYIAPADARRSWISGLTGSSGTALVTETQALLWTDSRYFTQFELQVDMSLWTLMRQGINETMQNWLVQNMPPGSIVGVDPSTISRSSFAPLQAALLEVNVTLLSIDDNLVDKARTNLGDPPPPRTTNPPEPLPLNYTGMGAGMKVAGLRNQMTSRGVVALVITALDEVAYTLNLRGSDIPYNPVFFAYLVILPSDIMVFWSEGVLPTHVRTHLLSESITGIMERSYSQVYSDLRNIMDRVPDGSNIWLSSDASEAIHAAVSGNSEVNVRLVSEVSPVALMKCIKNEVELSGMRRSYVKDGVALVRFLRWLHDEVDAGRNVTEVQAGDQADRFRSEEYDYVGPSFATIAGAGSNGAIIHYQASRDGEQRVIAKEDMFLFDSGAQYRDGTTDVTRTRHMSRAPTDWQRLTFTRVLKGQITLATALFPQGSKGYMLDTLARKALWDVGLNYAHGTSHGVGAYLNVHEGPSGIGTAPAANDPGISPGMVFSNEPGYYEVGNFGIRHEDIVETIKVDNQSDHIMASSIEDDFDGAGVIGFHTISLVPHQRECIDVNLLTDLELEYINSYHARVLATLGPILKERGLDEDYDFLERECLPLARLTTTTPTSRGHFATVNAAISFFAFFSTFLNI